MPHLVDLIDLVHPSVSGASIVTSDEIWILFDREIDETTVAGNFFITAPDTDTWSGPDLQLFEEDSPSGEEDILQSPALDGILQGTLSYQRVELDSLTVTSGLDTVGSGFLYRTKAVFTPTNRLAPSTEYQVYITADADPTDDIYAGIMPRTVFDAVPDGANTGTGDAEFEGGYTGTINDTYNILISTVGNVGTAKFQWYKTSVPGNVYGPLYTRRSGVTLANGIVVSFSEGEYDLADSWSCVVRPRVTVSGNLVYPFSTGSGSISTLPTTTSTSIIGTAASTTGSSSTTSFAVSETYPVDETSHMTIPAGDLTVKVWFSGNIDEDTIVDNETVVVNLESVNGDTGIAASGLFYPSSISVSSERMDIVLPSVVLNGNNFISITIDSSIANTDGVELGTDYEFWFTTTYSPMYSTLRKLRLEYGAFLTSVIDDTINLAIFEASLQADELLLGVSTGTFYEFARGEWVKCRAAEILLSNVLGAGGSIKSKKLGDLSVEYNTSGNNSDSLDRALACTAKWEPVVIAGTTKTDLQSPTTAIKGAADPDRPGVGRLWGDTSYPLANAKVTRSNYRRKTNAYDQGKGGYYPGGKKGRNWS